MRTAGAPPRPLPQLTVRTAREIWYVLSAARRPTGNDQDLDRRVEGETVTDQERQKAEELVSRLELSVGQIFPRDGGNASLIASMIQTLNGLRSVLGLVRPH